MKIKILVVLLLVVIACLLWLTITLSWELSSQGSTTPKTKTEAYMHTVFRNINSYAKEHNDIPKSLADLPEDKNRPNRTIDSWGNPLIYQIDNENNIIVLKSYGEDGVVGGSCENADFYISYYYMKEDGSFWAGDERWLFDAKIKQYSISIEKQ